MVIAFIGLYSADPVTGDKRGDAHLEAAAGGLGAVPGDWRLRRLLRPRHRDLPADELLHLLGHGAVHLL